MRIALLLARVTAACITTPASAEIFRCSTAGNVLGLDPCLDNEGPTNAMKDNIYEGPLHRAWTLLLQPALASEREQLEPTRWRFTLRKRVEFHNGNPFNADDVLAFLDRIRSEQPDMSFAVAAIERIDKIDDHTIEIVASAPDPTLLLSLAPDLSSCRGQR